MRKDETPLEAAERLAAALAVPGHLLLELHDLHRRQWRLEDESRCHGASPHRVAAAKRNIDACNLQRHRLVDAIDASITAVPDHSDERRYYSETVGELCDRLLILDLKLQALVDPGGLGQVREHLAVVVTHLIVDWAAGRAVLPPRVGVKIYNGAVA
jgi:hypothetical protein